MKELQKIRQESLSLLSQGKTRSFQTIPVRPLTSYSLCCIDEKAQGQRLSEELCIAKQAPQKNTKYHRVNISGVLW